MSTYTPVIFLSNQNLVRMIEPFLVDSALQPIIKDYIS
jgi:hypothetical protein